MHRLSSFGRPIRGLVIGAGGAIGGALVDALAACSDVEHVIAASRTPRAFHQVKVTGRAVDILDEASIASVTAGIERVDLAIVATGQLHSPDGLQPEKTWRALDKAMLLQSFAVNAVGPALVAKHVMPILPRQGKAVFAVLSARVGSISDNRLGGWYAYRASKAALNQIVRTLSIELARQRKEAVCVALHPGTVDSGLSRPFQSGVAEDKLFPPAVAASQLLSVIDSLDVTHSGRLLSWDGQVIAP